MSTTHLNRARLLLLALLVFFSPMVYGIGLGNATVESFLNQPLVVRIDVLVRPGEDLSGVTARLASAEDYALIGASRDVISVPLQFTVDTKAAQPFVRVTSSLPINQPVVRLIIELNWASGRLLREYTLFLDPPTVSAAAPPPVVDERRQPEVAAPTPAPEPVVDAPVDALAEMPESEAPEAIAEDVAASTETPPPAEAVTEQVTGESIYGPVQSGDTLWKIASNWSAGSDTGINQVMLAIQRSNPQAFINNNINRLKRGAILRMPSVEELSALSAAEASAEVQAQTDSLTGGVGPQPAVQAAASAVETPLVDVASEMSSSAPVDPPVDDSPVLEIVPPSAESSSDSAYGDEDSPEGSSASTSMVSLQEELARKEEALITEQQTNEYLQQRIKELEAQVAVSGPEGLEVEDEQMAQLEDRLREERLAAESAEAGNETPAPTATGNKQEPAKPWYMQLVTWLIAALVLVAAAAGWLLSRRGRTETEVELTAADQQTVREIKGEAETILKVLKPVEKPDEIEPAELAGEIDSEGEEAVAEPEKAKQSRLSQAKHLEHEEAFLLDEDNEDPEVRLDLARAYISMGDREAARAILEEVIENGDEVQKSDAQAMLDAM